MLLEQKQRTKPGDPAHRTLHLQECDGMTLTSAHLLFSCFTKDHAVVKSWLIVFIRAGTTRTNSGNIKYFLTESKICSKSVAWEDKRADSEGSLKQFYGDENKKKTKIKHTHTHPPKQTKPHTQDASVSH